MINILILQVLIKLTSMFHFLPLVHPLTFGFIYNVLEHRKLFLLIVL